MGKNDPDLSVIGLENNLLDHLKKLYPVVHLLVRTSVYCRQQTHNQFQHKTYKRTCHICSDLVLITASLMEILSIKMS